MNAEGYVTEGSGENIFVVERGTLVTPHTGHGCLAGVTRSAVMALARDLGFPVVEQNLVRTDLYTADEVLLHGHGRRDHADP